MLQVLKMSSSTQLIPKNLSVLDTFYLLSLTRLHQTLFVKGNICRGWLANHEKSREKSPPNLWQAPGLAIGRAQNVEPEKDGTHLIQIELMVASELAAGCNGDTKNCQFLQM